MGLPSIKYAEGDIVALKRAKNTMAARKSRQKQIDRLKHHEELVDSLMQKRDNLTRERNVWRKLAMDMGANYQPWYQEWLASNGIIAEMIPAEAMPLEMMPVERIPLEATSTDMVMAQTMK
jgi:hypothetical protein